MPSGAYAAGPTRGRLVERMARPATCYALSGILTVKRAWQRTAGTSEAVATKRCLDGLSAFLVNASASPSSSASTATAVRRRAQAIGRRLWPPAAAKGVGTDRPLSYRRQMAKVVHLPASRAPPDAGAWVRVRRSSEGGYQVEVCKDAPSGVVLTYDIDPSTFASAVWRARQHAERLGWRRSMS